MRSRSRTRFGLFASLTLGFVACGGRSTIDFGLDPGPAGGGGSGGFGGTGVVGGSGGISGDGGAPGGGAGGVAGEAGAPGGGASGAGGGGFCEDPGSPCEICTCDNCPDELKACADNGGCMPILACAQNAGCSGAQCLGPCGPVINQNGGPLGKSANLAQQVGQCRAQAKCDCGAGGSGGTGGGGGTGGTGTGGGGGTGPLACIGCVAQKCPSVQQCVLDQKCRDGAICAMQKCLSGGGGGPNLQCMIQCFNGDFGAAFQAFQGIQCFLTSCGQTCGGVIPGLPGGGTPPGG